MSMNAPDLVARTREVPGDPHGALVLFHARGAYEHDLFPLFDMLDPDARLLGLAPRGPLALPPGGAHWYVVRRVGYPDADTFRATFALAARWLDAALEEAGIPLDRTILGGFSQGAVMAYSLALGPGRTRPAGVIALSGFMPEVGGFDLDLTDLEGYPVAVGHGAYDPVIGVEFGRDAARRLEAAGADLRFRESAIDHTIDPAFLEELRPWVARVVPPR